MPQRTPEVTVVHKLTNCPDGRVCPARLTLDSRPGWTAIVGRIVTDPAEAAALGSHVGPGEAVVWTPNELWEENEC